MKLFRPIAILLLAASTIVSCKKDNTQPANGNVKLTANDNGKPASVKQGQTISITLGSPAMAVIRLITGNMTTRF